MGKWLFLLLIMVSQQGHAAPPPEANPAFHEWFQKQRSVSLLNCCSEADGHILDDQDWRSVGDHYEVRVNGQWFVVPGKSMRDSGTGGPNPTGHAVAWYVISPITGVTLYCFAPGFEG